MHGGPWDEREALGTNKGPLTRTRGPSHDRGSLGHHPSNIICSTKKRHVFVRLHFLRTPNLGFVFSKLCDRLWMILRSLNIRPIFDTEFSPYARCFDGKTGCGRFLSEFAKKWFSFEGNLTFCRQVQFPSREKPFFWKLAWEHIAARFLWKVERKAKIQYRR